MSYLPDLRAALVEAARQTYVDSPEPQKRHGRPRWLTAGGVATALAAAIAVAVAAVALVALGNRRDNGRSAASAPPTKAELRAAADQALLQVALPAGAVISGLHRGTPIELWSASDTLRIQHHVDVYRIWRLRQAPDRVISFLVAHRTAGSSPGFESEAASGASGRPTVVQQATSTISLNATDTGVWRELALNAVALPGGGTGLRVDSEAGWLLPRPASERIAPGVRRLVLTFAGSNPNQHRTVVIANPRRLQAFVSAFNALPAANPGTALCRRAPNGFLSFTFEGADRNAPLAVARWAPPCPDLELTIGARKILVMAGAPTMPAGAQIGELAALSVQPGLVSGPAASGSATLN